MDSLHIHLEHPRAAGTTSRWQLFRSLHYSWLYAYSSSSLLRQHLSLSLQHQTLQPALAIGFPLSHVKVLLPSATRHIKSFGMFRISAQREMVSGTSFEDPGSLCVIRYMADSNLQEALMIPQQLMPLSPQVRAVVKDATHRRLLLLSSTFPRAPTQSARPLSSFTIPSSLVMPSLSQPSRLLLALLALL